MAKSNEISEQVQAKVAQIHKVIATWAPGMFQSAVGGTEVESDGQRVLQGYELVGVPTNELGLPDAQEVIYPGWKSYEGVTVPLESGANSALAGTWRMPVIMNGTTKMLEGKLQVLRAGGAAPKFTFNLGIRQTFQRVLKDEAGKPTGKTEEGTSWKQPVLVDLNQMDGQVQLAGQRVLNDALGEAIALSHNISFEVK